MCRARLRFGLNLDGVVSFELGDVLTIGTGALRRRPYILTAAQIVDIELDGQVDLEEDSFFLNTQVKFYLPGGNVIVDIDHAMTVIPPEWMLQPGSDADLAIVTLAADAPAAAPRYRLYGQTNEVGKQAVVVGAGPVGHGSTGGDFMLDDGVVPRDEPHRSAGRGFRQPGV